MLRNKNQLSKSLLSTLIKSRRLSIAFTYPDVNFLQINGADTKKFLQGLCTNDVNALKKRGDCMSTVFLNTKGRIVGDATIFEYRASKDSSTEECVLLEIPKSVSESLLKHLKMYKLRSKVNFSFLPMKSIIKTSPTSTSTENQIESELNAEDSRSPIFGHKVLIPLDADSGSDQTIVDCLNYTRYRLLRGLPEGFELVNTIPLEMNLDFLHYISFTKGCYIGQELVARTYFKGQIRKRLIPFLLDNHPQTISVIDDNMRESFLKLTEDQIAVIESQSLVSLASDTSTTSVWSSFAKLKVFAASSSAISISPGSGSGCSGHGRWNGDGIDNTENVETAHEEVGEVISMNAKLGLGLALVRLTALYPNSTLDSSSSVSSSSSSSSHKSFYIDTVSPSSDLSSSIATSSSTAAENKIESSPSSSSSSLIVKKLPIVLFQPLWWPNDLDPQTGKLKVAVSVMNSTNASIASNSS